MCGLLTRRPSELSQSLLWPVVVALAVGTAAATLYYVQDLTLSHYDAKAHLVVARRIIDSLSPGWMQIGAVWLPLPHLLNSIPVQIDLLYRTGLSAVVMSVAAFVLGASSLWGLVRGATGSTAAAWAAFAVFAAHPDVLYLQATPMTESLLMGLCLLGITLTWTSIRTGRATMRWAAGLVLALACLTRYEAWPITAAAVALAAVAWIRAGVGWRRTVFHTAALACFPLMAVLAFMLLSHLTVGRWLVTGGFFEIEPATYRNPTAVLQTIWLGLRRINGDVMTAIGLGAFGLFLWGLLRSRQAAHLAVVLALAASVTLPMYAFWNGHPFRIRYLVPSSMVLAAVTGIGVGLLPRYRVQAASLVALTALLETPPLSGHSPMVIEAQRDATLVLARQRLTECLFRTYDRTPILASMGSLAPYMHETSRAGLSIRDFIHEGIGGMWAESLAGAGRHAKWVLIEEEAEGGDVLARRNGTSAEFLAGFERHCEGGGVALYRRLDRALGN